MKKTPKKIIRIKNKVDEIINDFKNKICMLECEEDCEVFYFPYLTIIRYNNKQHVFYSKDNRLPDENNN